MASLQELPDDELDKLFRASAEEFDPPFNPDDWDKLRRKLDDNDRTLFFDRLIYWGLPILLLAVLGIAFLVRRDDSSTDTNAKKPQPTAQAPVTGRTKPTDIAESHAEEATTAEGQPEKTTPGEAGDEKAAALPDQKPPAESVNKPAAGRPDETTKASETGSEGISRSKLAPASGSKTVRPNPAAGQSGVGRVKPGQDVAGRAITDQVGSAPMNENTVDKAGSRKRSGGNDGRLAGGPAFSGSKAGRNGGSAPTYSGVAGPPTGRRTNQTPGTSTSNDVVSENTETGARSANEDAASEPERFALTPSPAFLPAGSFIEPDSLELPTPYYEAPVPPVRSDVTAPKIRVIERPSLSIRAVGVPDLNYLESTATSEIIGKPASSFGYGLLAEFRFMNRFVIQTGVLQSRKKYITPKEAYNLPPYFYGKNQLSTIDALCTIVDFPINLRYDVLANARQRWFISVGTSTFVMKKERYKYNYQGYVHNAAKEWSNDTIPYQKIAPNKFSHLNFSIGYERTFGDSDLARRFSWQVEPFLKTPILGIGYGKIRLLSTGVYFSIRYRLY